MERSRKRHRGLLSREGRRPRQEAPRAAYLADACVLQCSRVRSVVRLLESDLYFKNF